MGQGINTKVCQYTVLVDTVLHGGVEMVRYERCCTGTSQWCRDGTGHQY